MDRNNWRPVMILPLPSKLLEKAVHFQLLTFVKNENILIEKQHSFRSHYSTFTAIFKLVKDQLANYNNNKSSV